MRAYVRDVCVKARERRAGGEGGARERDGRDSDAAVNPRYVAAFTPRVLHTTRIQRHNDNDDEDDEDVDDGGDDDDDDDDDDNNDDVDHNNDDDVVG